MADKQISELRKKKNDIMNDFLSMIRCHENRIKKK